MDPVIAGVMLWQHVRYLRSRRNAVQDRQPMLYSSDSFHVMTFLQVAVGQDVIEAVLLVPDNLFYNTSAAGIVMIVNRAKRHPGEILLINGTKQTVKGRPKNLLTEDNIDTIASVYADWKENEALSAVVAIEEVTGNDFNISPSRYVAVDGGEEVLPLEDAVVLLEEVEEERRAVDKDLREVLSVLGLRVGPLQ